MGVEGLEFGLIKGISNGNGSLTLSVAKYGEDAVQSTRLIAQSVGLIINVNSCCVLRTCDGFILKHRGRIKFVRRQKMMVTG